MSFSRTPSGLAAEYLFYKEVLVYVEGRTDFPFYEEVLRNYNYYLKAQGGKEEGKKLADALMGQDFPYVVVLDGDYDILTRTRSQHRRVVLLHRYSFENYIFEEEPIEQFCCDRVHSEDSLEVPLASGEFTDFFENVEIKFKDLLILDVAHQLSKAGQETFFRTPELFFKVNFRDDQIQKQQAVAAENIDIESVEEAKILVEKFVEKRCRLIYLLPGHFLFGIIRRFISNTVGKSIPNDEIRIYLSRVVWQLVNTHDHNSLKRRLRNAVRGAERIRHTQ